MKVLVLQRVIPSYRVAVFREITSHQRHDISVVIGGDLAQSKAKNARDLSGIRLQQLPARAITLLGRTFTHHVGLLSLLRREQPDVIVCEAESHFLAYLTAIFYKLILRRETKLLLWCFYALPGIDRERTKFHALVKHLARRCFDGFISYTSFGKRFLVSKGIPADAVTVAVNVCDTTAFLEQDQRLALTREEAKTMLGMQGKFVVSYIGTVDAVKRPDMVIDLAQRLQGEAFHFLIVGSGPLEDAMRAEVSARELTNVTMTGRITDGLARYYRATDLVVIPGRGGIVISESMCFGVPVLTHQADGVEHDLILDDLTGCIVQSGTVDAFEAQIRVLSGTPQHAHQLGQNAKRLIQESFNSSTMAKAIVSAIDRLPRSAQ